MEPLSVGDFLKWKPNYPKAIIGGGVMYPQSKVLVYGKKDSLKSMLAMSLGTSLTTGFPWSNLAIEGKQKVVYLQSEIPHLLLHKRIQKMVSAWRTENGSVEEIEEKMYVWTEPFLKLDSGAGLSMLTKVLATLKPDVLIIDPLYKALSGNIMDPNSVRLLVDSLDKIIGQFNVSLILIHHTRKGTLDEQPGDFDSSDDMLGSAVFSWWADTIIKVVRKGGNPEQDIVTLSFDKVRHAEDVIKPRRVLFNRETLLFTPSDKVIL